MRRIRRNKSPASLAWMVVAVAGLAGGLIVACGSPTPSSRGERSAPEPDQVVKPRQPVVPAVADEAKPPAKKEPPKAPEPVAKPELVAAPAPAAPAKPGAPAAQPVPTDKPLALRVGAKGITIDAGAMGSFTLSYPKMKYRGKEQGAAETRADKNGASLRYGFGGQLEVETRTTGPGAGEIVLSFGGTKSGIESFKMDMHITNHFRRGGKWEIGDAKGAFPKSKPPKPHLFQGSHKRSFTLINFEGKRLSFSVPQYNYQQLQDNLEWKWDIFAWWFSVPFDQHNPRHVIKVTRDVSAAKRVVLVDRFGQNAQEEFPIKVHSVEELKEDARTEGAYYDSLPRGKKDRWGGMPGSKDALGLRQTGYFHVEKKRGKWLMVDPDGNAFFQLGVCSFGAGEDYTFVKGRRHVYEWLPPFEGEFRPAWHNPDWRAKDSFSFYRANTIRKYGAFDREERYGAMIDRTKAMGFNSCGAFCGPGRKSYEEHWGYTPTLPLGRWSLGKPLIPGVRGVFDPFDEATVAQIDKKFKERIAPKAEDALIIGYFLDNEQGFEDIPRAVPALPGKHACKRRLVKMLRDKYRSTEKFKAAWGIDVGSFDELTDRGLAVKTKQAFADMHAYTGLLLEKYYSVIRATFDKYDRNHMLIGNRWQPGTANNEQLCRVAGKYMDVISVNYYTYAIDREFITRIYEWTGRKPQMWTEFHYGSSTGAGLPGRVDVGTQEARGLAYRNYVEGAASLGFVLGVQWFILVDQPLTGRWFEGLNGEAFNIGLINVADRPFKEMIQHMVVTNNEIYEVMLGKRAPYEFDDPRFKAKGGGRKALSVTRAVGTMKMDGMRDGWPGAPPVRIGSDRLVLGADAGGVDATFLLSWDDTYLYLLAQVTDSTPMMNPRSGGSIWNGDGIELFVGHEDLDAGGALRFTDRQVLLSAGTPREGKPYHVVNAPAQPEILLGVVKSASGYALEAGVPWSALGIRPKVGMKLLFDIAVDDGAGGNRLRQLMWNGIARNSSDRSKWGIAKLAR